MKYEIAQRVKGYGWVVTATGLTRHEAEAHRKALKGARIYPMREVSA